jgi:hypothetical protein
MKIRPVEAELFHVDRHDEANSRFLQFCERAKKLDDAIRRENSLSKTVKIYWMLSTYVRTTASHQQPSYKQMDWTHLPPLSPQLLNIATANMIEPLRTLGAKCSICIYLDATAVMNPEEPSSR